MRPQARLALATLLLALGAAACAPRLVAPQLSVASVALLGGGFHDEHVRIGLHVVNPNDRAIRVRGLEARLQLAGKPFATGSSESAFSVPANGASDFQLDVTADMGSALSAVAASFGRPAIPYHLDGEVHLQGGLVRTLHFSHDGQVHLGGSARID